MSSIYTNSMPMHGELSLPTVSFTQVELPELVNWEVNGEYYLVLKVKQVATRNHSHLDSKEDRAMMEADFQITSIKALGREPFDANAAAKADFENTIAQVKLGRL